MTCTCDAEKIGVGAVMHTVTEDRMRWSRMIAEEKTMEHDTLKQNARSARQCHERDCGL